MTKRLSTTQIRNFSKNWYFMGRSLLPPIESSLFAESAMESYSLVAEILRNSKDFHSASLRVDKNVDTGYVKLLTKEIFISAKYFYPEYVQAFLPKEKDNLEELAVCLINGTILHEALHIKHTPHVKSIGDVIKHVGETHRFAPLIKALGKNAVYTAINIMEDLYIESRAPHKAKLWLRVCNSILFSESRFEAVKEITSIEDALNIAILYKLDATRDHKIFNLLPSEALSILKNMTMGGSLFDTDRVVAAADYLNVFIDMFPPTEDSSDDSSTPSDAEISDESRLDEAATKSMSEIEVSDEVADDLDTLAKDISDKVSKELSDKTIIEGKHSTISYDKVVEQDVFKADQTAHEYCYPIHDINIEFVKELQAIRTLNRTPGQARSRGSVMVKSRLTRIATDGKIFSKRDAERRTDKRIEIIILVDGSGSAYKDIYRRELGTAKDMSKALLEAGVAHSVYVQTSRSKRRQIPSLVHVFSYDMIETNVDWDDRFQAAERIALNENYDGAIIERLRTKYTGRQAARYMLIMSDGRPAGPGYSGQLACEHTRNEVVKTRKHNIGVISISVVNRVIKKNDEIYGKEYNINGSINTTAQFRKLLRKLVKEVG